MSSVYVILIYIYIYIYIYIFIRLHFASIIHIGVDVPVFHVSIRYPLIMVPMK